MLVTRQVTARDIWMRAIRRRRLNRRQEAEPRTFQASGKRRTGTPSSFLPLAVSRIRGSHPLEAS